MLSVLHSVPLLQLTETHNKLKLSGMLNSHKLSVICTDMKFFNLQWKVLKK